MGQPLGPLRIKAPLTLGGGGGFLPIKERVPPWQTPEDDGGSSRGKVDDQEFPVLGTQKTARKVTGPADPDDTERDRRPSGHPIPVSRGLDWGMRPAGNIRSVRKGNCDVRARGVQEPLTSPLSPLADSFNPRPTSEKQKNKRQLRPNKLTFLVLVSIPLKKWRCGANFFFFFFFKRGQIAGYSYAYKYVFNGV